jgi:hypothetical protein
MMIQEILPYRLHLPHSSIGVQQEENWLELSYQLMLEQEGKCPKGGELRDC